MSGQPQSSGLFYCGTNIEMRLGDRIEVKRFLRKPQRASVCYIPGISERNACLDFDDVRQWAFSTADGSVYPCVYDPQHLQPPKHIRFIERTDDPGIGPDLELH